MIIIQFNEAILELIKKYSIKYNLKSLKKISDSPIITTSEQEYEKLEPWIQWTSFYSSKTADEHKVFKLGDYTEDDNNFFFKLANKGKKVGIFCSMNQYFHKSFNFFVPDPWSKELSDQSYTSVSLKKITNLVVNRNAQLKVPKDIFINLLFLIFKLPISKIIFLSFKGLISIIKKDRSSLAGLLDYFLINLVLKIHIKNNLDLSTVFLNGLAHVQHHYLYNSEFVSEKNPDWYMKSEKDPIREILFFYEKIFCEIENSKIPFIVITGLGQKILDKPELYWRFKNHKKFFDFLLNGFDYECIPKMSRDFYLNFKNNTDALNAKNILEEVYFFSNEAKKKAFGFLKINNNSLFGSLIYDLDTDKSKLIYKNDKFELNNEIDFVAIKNSIHDEKGWAYISTYKKFKSELKSISISNFSAYLCENIL